MNPPALNTNTSIEDGDRYVTTDPCGPGCQLASHSPTPSFLAVAPYSFVFTAPVKGRWLQRCLLALFVKEFAFVPPPQQVRSVTSADEDAPALAVSLDPRITVAAYVEELCEGQLWLHGRESECRAAGRCYQKALHDWYRTAQTAARAALQQDNITATATTALGEDAVGEETWRQVKCWLSGRLVGSLTAHDVATEPPVPSAQEVEAWLTQTAPSLLVLRQRDIVKHRVWRREGRLFAEEPLHILRCDSTRSPRLLVVSKPCGLPVHPSGAYRKNSVTSLLEDVFGGVDRHRYRVVVPAIDNSGDVNGERADDDGSRSGACEARRSQRYVSVVHAERGFELIRIWTAPCHAEDHSTHGVGVSAEDLAWLVSRVGPAAARKRARSPRGHTPESGTAPQGSATEMPPHEPAPPLKVHVVHRLDAATSGVLLFGLDSDSARQLAVAIAHKEAAPADDGADGSSTADPTEAGASSKAYVALVHGRVDVEELIRTQRGCEREETHRTDAAGSDSRQPPSLASSPSSWVRLSRSIGCLSFHESTYWSPGPAREAQWRQEKTSALAAQCATMTTPNGGVVGGETSFDAREEKPAGVASQARMKSAEALAAKHARMRAMTQGHRASHIAETTPILTEDDANHAPGLPTRLQAFVHTLKTATTCLRVLWYNPVDDTSLVECQLLTGRTHQLRVHLATLGHAIVGDAKYVSLSSRLGVREWQTPAHELHDARKEDEDGVAQYYQRGTTRGSPENDGGDASSFAAPQAEEARGCVCPHRICLHAQRYVLSLGHTPAETITAVAPLPAWATPPRS